MYHAAQTVSIRPNCRSMMGGSTGLQLGMISVSVQCPYTPAYDKFDKFDKFDDHESKPAISILAIVEKS